MVAGAYQEKLRIGFRTTIPGKALTLGNLKNYTSQPKKNTMAEKRKTIIMHVVLLPVQARRQTASSNAQAFQSWQPPPQAETSTEDYEEKCECEIDLKPSVLDLLLVYEGGVR